METRLDELSKLLGSGVSRRAAFKVAAASALAAALSALGVREAEADGPSPSRGPRACRRSGDPPCTEIGCHGFAPETCGCIPKVNGRGMCHECQPCEGLKPCTTTAECRAALGRAWKCATSCCEGGSFCHPKCGAVPSNCGGAAAGRRSLG